MPVPEDVDWEGLSPEGRWIVLEIAMPLAEGKTQKAVADELGVSPRKLRRALDDLADEIRLQHRANPVVSPVGH